MELFRRLNDEGTTIVQVTHSEQNAAFGNRIIKLSDGWLVKQHETHPIHECWLLMTSGTFSRRSAFC